MYQKPYCALHDDLMEEASPGNLYCPQCEGEKIAIEGMADITNTPTPEMDGLQDAIDFLKANRYRKGFETAATMLDGLLSARERLQAAEAELAAMRSGEAVEFDESDLRFDVPNKPREGQQVFGHTPSGVRVLHIPSGISATADSERSQHKNREKALEKLSRALFRSSIPAQVVEVLEEARVFIEGVRDTAIALEDSLRDFKGSQNLSNPPKTLYPSVLLLEAPARLKGGANAVWPKLRAALATLTPKEPKT